MGYDFKRNTPVTKLPKLHPAYSAFIKNLRDKCSYWDVTLVFVQDPVVYWDSDDKDGARGYFYADNDIRTLVCSVQGDPDIWMGTLVHESCHMDQWIDDDEQWSTLNKSFSKFWGWLAGDLEVSKRKLQLYTRDIQLIELDCERRAIEKIKQFDLPIDKIKYIQKSCTYIYSYNHVVKTRKWFVGKYDNPDVYTKAPSSFPYNISHTPKKLNKAFKKYFV